MLTDEQKKMIELECEDFASMGEHGYLNGMEYVLDIIGESDFKQHLYTKYRG